MARNITKKEMSKSKKITSEVLEIFRNWYIDKIYIPKLNDNDLAFFLHQNDYSLESAKEHMRNYYILRAELPGIFKNRDLHGNANLENIVKTITAFPLKDRTPQGYRVILTRLLKTDPAMYNFNDAMKHFNMVLDLCIHEEPTEEYIIIVDLNRVMLGHFQTIDLKSMQKLFTYFNKGVPIKFKGIHYFNSGPTQDKYVNEFIQIKIVNNKDIENAYFHETMSSLNSVVPLELLPQELGGKSEMLLSQHYRQYLKMGHYSAWFTGAKPFYDRCVFFKKRKRDVLFF